MRSTRSSAAATQTPCRVLGASRTRLTIELDGEQKELLRARARTAGLTLPRYVRQVALASGEPPTAAPVATAAALGRLAAAAMALEELAADLARHGAPGRAARAAVDLLHAVAAETVEIRRLLLTPVATAAPRRGAR